MSSHPGNTKTAFLRPKQRPQAKLRLFCFPHAGAGAAAFRGWAEKAPADVDVVLIQCPGRENRLAEPPYTNIPDLTEHLGSSLVPLLDIPFVFLGHSMGGLVAFEVARWLRQKGHPQPEILGIAAARAPHLPWPFQPVHRLGDLALLEAIDLRYGGVPALIKEDPELRQLLTPSLRADMQAVETYAFTPDAPLGSPIVAFGGSGDKAVSAAALRAWERHTSNRFELTIVPDGHLFQLTHAQTILDALTQPGTRVPPVINPSRRGASEPIAIVGFGCRLPGAKDVASFWRLLAEGREGTEEYDQKRSPELDAIYAKDVSGPKAASSRGGFLRDLDTFDAEFFGLAPREASALDPQQRLLLETAWEALEDAGLTRNTLAQRTTGVFTGIWASDFEHILYDGSPKSDIYQITGAGRFPGSGRLSYFLNATGPSITIDTACSSSLVAVHLARRSLLDGECDIALAAGVNVLLRPEITLGFTNAGMLSKEGRCKFGAASADGFVRSEGSVVTVLKRMSDAERDGDRIYAVIRGSVVNNDGQGSGLLMKPSIDGQADLIRRALEDAQVSADDLSYLEAHGTGTLAGDPVELTAIGNVLATGNRTIPCPVGSVKTNLGHTEGAAGLAGLMKVALALHHRLLPASLHCQQPNPEIAWAKLPIRIQNEASPWEQTGKPRLAGVSAFGITGTNAHAILSEAPAHRAPTASAKVAENAMRIVPLSAHSVEALRESAKALASVAPLPELDDASYTLATRRTHHAHRLAVVASSTSELTEKLSAFAVGENVAGVVNREAKGRAGKIAFVFPGQGSQWFGMGRELLKSSPAFRAAMERCDAAIEAETGWRVTSVLQGGDEAKLKEIDIVQPVLFAISVALAAHWRSWGIEPDGVIGHSMGEVAAACVAGALSLEDAAAVIARRSRLMKRVRGTGSMALVELSMAELETWLTPFGEKVSIGASNGDSSTVISGETRAVETLLTQFETAGVFARQIKVDVASHSSQVDPLLDDLFESLQTLRPGVGTIPMYSTVRSRVEFGEALDARYWVDNLRQRVLFAPGIRQMLDSGFDTFVEISGHPLLLNAIEGMLASSNTTGLAIGSLRRETSEIATLLESLGALHCFGQSVDWARQYPAGTCVSLATYPFQRERLWPELVEKQTLRRVEHRLLGRRVDSSANPDTVLFENEISGESPAYLADHIVRDQIVLPASGHCEMALAAAGALFGEGPVTLQDVEIQKAVVLPAKETRKVQLVGHRQGPDRVQFEIRAMEDDGTWALCSHGLLLRGAKEAAAQTLEQARDRCQNEISVAAFYQGLAEAGLPYGAAFQAVQEIWEGESEFLSRIQLRTETDKERFHPAMLDGGLQAVVHGAMDWSGDERTWVPIGIRRLCFYADSADKQLFAHFAPAQPSVDDGTFGGNLEFYSADGKLVAAVEEIRFRRLAADDPGRNCLHQTVWEPLAALPQQPLSQQTTGGACIVLGDAPELLHALRSAGKQFRTVATSEAADLDRLFSEPEVRNATAIVYTSSQREVFGDSLPGICTTPVRLLQALLRAGLPQSPRLWMVTTGTQDPDGTSQTIAVEQAPLWGLGRVIALEHPEYQPSTVDLSPSPTAKEYAQLVRLIDAQPSEDEIAIRGDRYFVARLDTWDAPAKAMPKAAAYRVAPSQPGVLDSLELEAISDAPPGSGEVQVNVRAAGINFHDVLGALGLVADGPNGVLTLGMEFAGEVDCVGDAVKGTAPGDRVFGVASPYRTSTLASQVTVPATYVRPMPLAWDFETAGSQPIVFLTAWYGLHELARLKKGERVLIHSGAGGVGMAAIQIALRAGAEVYATAGNEEKREFLRRLGVKHVFDSRSLGFADEIWAASAGAGVHVVLNSLAGGFLERSLELLAPYGRFVELGKRDVGENRSLGLSQFGRNISFFVVDLADMLERRSEWIAGALDDICALFAAGEISPLPVTSFEAADAALIFQNMARGQHIGKLALKFSGPASLAATDEFLFRADATYLITGGMGGIGLEVARWLADKGARHVALAGRRGPSAAASHQIEALRARGVRVATHLADISQEGDVRRVIAEIDGSGAPLRGVFHAAAVVRDQLLRDLDTESTEAVFSPKVKGAWHLHQATLHRDLDCFVLFSSIAAILPQPGHGSYSAANSFLDALARLRKKQGLPALSVNWGGWRGVGLASLEGTQRTLRGCARRGVPSMTAASALDALNHALRGEQANLLISPIHASRLTRAYDGEAMPAVLRRLATSAPAETANLQSSLLSELMHAQSGPERREMLEEHLKEQASRVLRLSAARIQRTRPLGQMGLDSLMSVEYVNRLRATLSLPLAGTTVFNYPTIAKLADHIARRLDISLEDQATCSDTIPETAPKIPDSIDELSEEQALEMLMSGDWRP